MVIAVLVIKSQDQKNLAIKTDTSSTTDPINPNILNAQNIISADREKKLRELSSTPQALKTQQTTTKTNTAVTNPNPVSTPSATRTTKKS